MFPPPSQRSSALKLDWAKVTTSLGLRGQTVTSLHAFKKRNDDARRKLQALQDQPTQVDFSQYRSVLKNQAVVDEIEKRFAAFRPATYDVARQIKAIDAFEVEAVKNAEATKDQVNMELQDLNKTLQNIEQARPFEDLTVVRISAGPTWAQALILGRGLLFWVWLTMGDYRTMSPLPSPRSTRRPLSLLPRAAGSSLDTRYVIPFRPTGLSSFAALTPCRRNSATSRCYKQIGRQLSLMYCYDVVIVDRIESGVAWPSASGRDSMTVRFAGARYLAAAASFFPTLNFSCDMSFEVGVGGKRKQKGMRKPCVRFSKQASSLVEEGRAFRKRRGRRRGGQTGGVSSQGCFLPRPLASAMLLGGGKH
ncbi:hypothetical protein IMZ48_04810 [Candidatus Bathyarchaeota archaeon]|nr:hypothetical protein [Candidatus Bathyarchaeota archaeon]